VSNPIGADHPATPPAPAAPPVGAAAVFRGPFMVAAIVLAMAALVLTTSIQRYKLYFQKQAVAIARPLKEIPTEFGPWKLVTKDEPLESDIEHVLGTKEYVFRWYVDERAVGPEVIKAFADLSGPQRQHKARELAFARPGSAVQLAVTYYTGMVDTVAHIPDRCYVADGFVPSEYETVKWVTGPSESTEARFINFEDQTGTRRVPINVAYFFRVNDEYQSDPNRVRLRLQRLSERYGFYAKVELMTLVRDRAKAATAMQDFLGHAMPEVSRSFPDWQQVTKK
jgi:hypothetical protein